MAVGSGLAAWAAGIGLVGWAVHTTNVELGGIAFWAGLLIGNVGVVAAMLWLGAQLEKHGH